MDHFSITLFATLTFAACASSKQVVLMPQTPDCNSCVWSWSTYHFTCNMCRFSGWDYPSIPGQNIKNRYSVCNVLLPGHTSSLLKEPNNWLRSDLIHVKEVQKLDVIVKYAIIKCPDTALFCKEFFYVYVWESNTSVASHQIPDPLKSNSSYRRFANIARKSSDNPTTSIIPLVVTSKYIVLGFRDQGGCRTLYSVTVTYNACSQQTFSESLVSVPQTLAPITESLPVKGNCTAGSVPVQGSLYVLCESSGEWNTSLLEGRCICKEDMENTGGKCEDCKNEEFEYNNQRGLNCTALPSAPKNFSIRFVNQSAVGLNWQPPEITGDHSHVFYDVICLKQCHSDDGKKCVEESCRSDVRFIPHKKGLNETQVIVINLLTFVNYTFKIYARNRVSEMAKRKYQVEGNFTAITVRTLGTIPGKPEVFIEQTGVTVYVSWTLKHKNGFIKNYHVTYVNKDDSSDRKSLATNKTKQDFEDLKAGKTYEFQVFAENSFGKGPVAVNTFTVQNGGVAEKLVVPIAAGGGSLLFILLLVIVIIILVLRRRKSKRNVQRDYMRSIEQGGELGQRQYINPANYVNLMELLSTFASEIERSKTKLEGLIGQGEFADVYKGTLKTQGSRDVVAVKVLRPGSNEKNQKDFLSEASIMGQFNHPNVIRLIGVVTQSRPMMILTEFLESGSLDHFLKDRDGQLTSLQLVGMARGVACGMVYLSEKKNLIHRDLAARNILVGENMLCKVSDFGLSRELTDDNPESEYETQGGKIAVRWTAPEALQHRKFSSASDVWSYGILVWEIMSFCDRPYWEWNNIDVINRVQFGYRLPPPKGCPKVIHSLMMECWESDKNERPKFAAIVSCLDKIIRSPDVLKDVSLALGDSEVEAGKQTDMPEFESVEEWLIFLKMDSHLELFQAANVDSLDRVKKLEDKDLREMGVKLIGHRNKMNKSIKSMKGRFVNRGMDGDEAAI